MAGAACGLFVAAHVGSSIALLTSQGFLLLMMLIGAIGFYLGIDTPPLPFNADGTVSRGRVDAAEFLSAVGTFLATLAAFVSVGVIVARETPGVLWTLLIMGGWILGVVMQIVAGAAAEMRG